MCNHYFSLIRAVWYYGANWRVYIVSYYLILGVAQLFLSLSPYAFGKAIDELQDLTFGSKSRVIFWLLIGVSVVFLFWLFQAPGRVIERSVALKIQHRFRLNFYEQLIKLPLKWHQEHHSGNIIARINRSSIALYHFAENQFDYIQNIIKFIIATCFLLWISLLIGFISLCASLIVMLVVIFFDGKLIALYSKSNEIENHIGMVLFDYISNITTLLALRIGQFTRNSLFQHMMSIWPFFRKEIILNELKWFSIGVLFSIVQTAILIFYISYTLNSEKTVMLGMVVMIFRYQWELSEVLQDLSVNYSEVVRISIDVQSIQPILEDFSNNSCLYNNISVSPQWHTIQIKNLILKSNNADNNNQSNILDKMKLKITRGEKIALIGLSGSGKSTLLNLLAGLYVPDRVDLIIDKMRFNSIEPLQSITTLITQDPEVFANTIKFNITFGLPVKLDQIWEVIKLVEFADVINSFPKGLETDLREKGLNLSVGQKQRLILARGLLAALSSSLILMDEPTSSIDFPTEKKIITNIINTFPKAAVVISMHRLHLLPKFDSVIMLEDKKIVAYGATQILLSKKGPIRDLFLNATL